MYDKSETLGFRNGQRLDDSLSYLIAAWLLLTVFLIGIVIQVNVCSKLVSKKIDKTIKGGQETINSVISLPKKLSNALNNQKTQAKEIDKSSPPIETEEVAIDINSTPQSQAENSNYNHLMVLIKKYALLICLVLFVIVIVDLYYYFRIEKIRSIDWIIFFPLPLIAPLFFMINVIMTAITGIVMSYKHNDFPEQTSCADVVKKIIQQADPRSWYILITLPFTATTILFCIVHGFWLILAFVAYPVRVITSCLFNIPVFSPLLPLISIVVYLLKKTKEKKTREATMTFFGLVLFILFWGLFMVTLYKATIYLLVITDVQNKWWKILVSVVIVSLLIDCLSRSCKPSDDSDEETTKKPPQELEEIKIA